MIKKIVSARNLILAILAVLWLLLGGVTLIMGGIGKCLPVLLSLVCAFSMYGAVILIVRILKNSMYSGMACFFGYLFLALGTFGVLYQIIRFVLAIPNGFSPVLLGCSGLVIAALDTLASYVDT